MQELRNQIIQSCESIGLPYLSNHTCCQLLAFTYVCGGGCEYTVVNKKLNTDIMYAQRRANIIGSETPNPEMTVSLNNYIKELQTTSEPPQWAVALCEKYGIPSVFLQNK